MPDSWSVCGVDVPPLSIWHVFALENIGNAYIVGGTPAMDDAMSLLLYAQRDMQHGRKLLSHDNYRARAIRRLYRKLRKQKPEDVDAACLEYVTSCMRHGHRMSVPGGGGTPAGSPETWAIVSVVSVRMEWTAAWDTPYAVGRAMLDAHDERNGNTVMTPWSYGEEMHDNWDYWSKQTEQKEVTLSQPSPN